jgi:DNA-binding response OmpR family regulator
MASAVLLAAPEPDVRGFLEQRLARDGFEVVGAVAGCEALDLAEQADPALVLLASSLPDADPFDLCRRIRAGEPGRSWNREVPLIVLGDAGAGPLERAMAFDKGCDDFVTAPYVFEELLGRIRALLRRTRTLGRERIETGGLEIELFTRRVLVGGEAVSLGGKEYALLLKLASDPDRVWTKAELLREVWGFVVPGRTRTLDSHASRVRRKLTRPGLGPYVVNFWGVGYKLHE